MQCSPLRSSRRKTVAVAISSYTRAMLIIGIILFGLLVGAVAQLVVGRSGTGIDWTLAFVAGVGGSFVGGLLISLLAGDGLELRPSGSSAPSPARSS